MAIIKSYHKDTDTTYVYEQTSYWDKEKKQPRSKRKLIGKIDKETGEIVPTGNKGRRKKQQGEDQIIQSKNESDILKEEIRKLKKENDSLRYELERNKAVIIKIRDLVE